MQYLDCCKAQHPGHQAVGDLVRSPYHDFRGDQPVLQMGIGAFDGRADLEPLFLDGRENALCFCALVRVDDGDPATCDDEIIDGSRIVGAVHQ